MPAPHPQHTLTAAFYDKADALQAYEWLKSEGYTPNEISLMMSDTTAPPFHAVAGSDKIEAKDAAAPGAEASGAAGVAIGAGTAAVVAAGVGLVMGGPVVAALAASIPGALVGGLVGGVIGYGFPEQQAKEYEPIVKQGGVAMSVTLKQNADANYIRKRLGELRGSHMVVV